ncbi:unnamed protein product, partial [Ectocarpus fasciculatus]
LPVNGEPAHQKIARFRSGRIWRARFRRAARSFCSLPHAFPSCPLGSFWPTLVRRRADAVPAPLTKTLVPAVELVPELLSLLHRGGGAYTPEGIRLDLQQLV